MATRLRRLASVGLTLATAAVGLTVLTAAPTVTSAAGGCALPASGTTFQTSTPEQQQVDPAAVGAAIAYAQTHLRASVQIFRNDCKIGQGALDPVTDHVPMEVFSSTKSVVSILTGMAYDRGLLQLDDPIGKYLPAGEGDAAHRAITIRNLLTETSGLDEAILAEFASVGLDPDIEQEALAQPLTHKPGTHFEYSQRDPDLMSVVLQDALGQDLQSFAQRRLFGPVGIPQESYVWLRDRTKHTYGYANLFIPPTQFAKLGLLMQNDGVWRGQRIVPARYIAMARAKDFSISIPSSRAVTTSSTYSQHSSTRNNKLK